MIRPTRLVVLGLLAFALSFGVACNDSNGSSSGEEDVDERDGDYAGEGTFTVDMTVSGAGGAPVEGSCAGDIDLVVAVDEDPQAEGEGGCLFPANFASFTITADFVDAENVEGTISFTFNLALHNVPFTGKVSGEAFTGTFNDTTAGGGGTTIRWDGEFTADLQ